MRMPAEVQSISHVVMRDQVSVSINGRWVPARPEPYHYSWWKFKRLRIAIAVFTGKADALFWDGQ